MSKDPYIRELGKIFNDDSPAKPTSRSREEIESEIAEISETLKGPLDNITRLDLVEARRELRKQLAAMEAS